MWVIDCMHYTILTTFTIIMYLSVCTKGSNFLFAQKWITHLEVNLHYGDLYGRWRTEQLVNSSWRYVSATPVWRILSQELVETTILWATHDRFKSCPDVSRIKIALQLLPLSAVILISTNFRTYTYTPVMGLKLGTGLQYHSIYYIHSLGGTD